MWAKNENGTIKTYTSLPNRYVDDNVKILGGFNKLPVEELKLYGFYPYVLPNVSQGMKLGAIFFDDSEEIFTHDVLPLSQYEIDMMGWHDDTFNLRIKILLADVMSDEGLQDFMSKLILWWNLTKLVHEIEDGTAYFYCNFIMPEHQAIINAYSSNIVLENKPVEA